MSDSDRQFYTAMVIGAILLMLVVGISTIWKRAHGDKSAKLVVIPAPVVRYR